jgi:hypothetical protein
MFGHEIVKSTVGATQDLAALDIDLAAITEAGGLEINADAASVCGEDQCG